MTYGTSPVEPIHTLNTRSHIVLDLLRDYDGLSAEQMMSEIRRLHSETINILAEKNIEYAGLRSGLVPQMDRQEALFLFDSEETGSSLYGPDVFDHLLPVLDPRTTQSILVGDLLGDNQQLILDILRESLQLARPFTFRHGTLIFGVYLNNLTDTSVERLNRELTQFPAYIGYIPTTFMSRAKIYASTTMAGFLLKKGKTLIMSHEDDRSNSENINITPYRLEKHGYTIASLQGIYQSIFLTFKIERPVFPADIKDQEHSLNAISRSLDPPTGCKVLLEEAKHGYLINQKLGKLKKAELDQLDRVQIERIIESKVAENYIYNLAYISTHNVIKFNIMLELERVNGYPTRVTAALEYLPESKTLRVITLH